MYVSLLFFKLIIYLIPFFSFLAAEPDSYWSGDHCVIIMFISFSGDSLIIIIKTLCNSNTVTDNYN